MFVRVTLLLIAAAVVSVAQPVTQISFYIRAWGYCPGFVDPDRAYSLDLAPFVDSAQLFRVAYSGGQIGGTAPASKETSQCNKNVVVSNPTVSWVLTINSSGTGTLSVDG